MLTHIQDSDIANIYRVSNNAYKAYIQTRPTASVDSNKKVKHVKFNALQVLEEFQGVEGIVTDTSANEFKANLLEQMKKYKAKSTIFELNPKLNDTQFLIMREKRKVHESKIQKFREKVK